MKKEAGAGKGVEEVGWIVKEERKRLAEEVERRASLVGILDSG